jgi:hypothetical protein
MATVSPYTYGEPSRLIPKSVPHNCQGRLLDIPRQLRLGLDELGQIGGPAGCLRRLVRRFLRSRFPKSGFFIAPVGAFDSFMNHPAFYHVCPCAHANEAFRVFGVVLGEFGGHL